MSVSFTCKDLISTRSLCAEKIIHTVSIISTHSVALGVHTDAVEWAGYIERAGDMRCTMNAAV